ncbi:MAG TPA: phosphatase PAP2 family protein [Ignavibacteria bacterium]|nr:phosphatase PAP2 family protein [Ignavibacteria bacterium]
MLSLDTISNLPYLGFNNWDYVVIFFAAFLEATPFFGLFVPGMLIVIAGGFMVKLGILDIGDIVVVASLGAIFGDLAGYFLGKKYGVSFLEKYGKYFFFRKKQFERTKMLMNNHTGKSLIIGRFNSLTRSFAPFVAGSMGTPFRKFLLFNIVGGVAWAITFISVGFIFGQSYEAVASYVGKFMTIAIVVSIGIVYAYRFINKRRHIFSRYSLYVLTLNLLSLYLFAKMVESIFDNEVITKFDIFLNQKVSLFWSVPYNEIMIFITSIANPINLFSLSVILLGFLVFKKKWYYSGMFVVGMTGGLLLELAVKFLVHRERPVNALIDVSGYSFPSGHAAMAIIFFVLLAYAFKDDIKNKIVRILFMFGVLAVPVLIGISRVYLNVHWFSDVIAGFALGMFWLTLLVLVFRFITSTKPGFSKYTFRYFKKFKKQEVK